jgi:2-polyprenyl-3-methyl-5-hydroxy-6-metoxy-1,4-benzoquinol methylase
MANFEQRGKHPCVAKLRMAEAKKYDPKYFAEHYWREDLPGLTGNRGLTYDDPGHGERFSFLVEALVLLNVPRQLLDVGCGPGFLLEKTLSNGIRALGIDVSATARNLFSERSKGRWPNAFVVGSLGKLPWPDRAFDLCICLDVLEHLIVFDIFDAVQEMCRVSSAEIICSINLDNPYRFHPTILSRDTWISVFESTGLVHYQDNRSLQLNAMIQARYSEYEFFSFLRMET